MIDLKCNDATHRDQPNKFQIISPWESLGLFCLPTSLGIPFQFLQENGETHSHSPSDVVFWRNKCNLVDESCVH